MKPLVWLFFGGFLVLCEVFAGVVFGSETWTPPLWTIFVLWLAIRPPSIAAMVVIILTGFWADGFSGGPVGTHGTTGLIVYLLALQLTVRLQLRFVGMLVLGALGGLLTILVAAVTAKIGGGADIGTRLSALFVPRIVTMALLTPLMLPILDPIERLVGRRQQTDRI